MTNRSENCTVILASGSPRRIEMMKWLNSDHEVLKPEIDESIHDGEDVAAYSDRVAREKWDAVTAALPTDRPFVVISADTIVIRDGKRYGKPIDQDDAYRILRELRGKFHVVHSALVVGRLTAEGILRYESGCDTRVKLDDFSEEKLTAYVESGDPLGKAGAYAIQNADFNPASEYEGCYACVVGLPLCHLDALLRKVGAAPERPIEETCRFRRQGLCELNCAAVQAGMTVRKSVLPIQFGEPR